MASDPLVIVDTKRMGDRGAVVNIYCPEPSPCMSATLHGFTAVVNAGAAALERIHQTAHALKEES